LGVGLGVGVLVGVGLGVTGVLVGMGNGVRVGSRGARGVASVKGSGVQVGEDVSVGIGVQVGGTALGSSAISESMVGIRVGISARTTAQPESMTIMKVSAGMANQRAWDSSFRAVSWRWFILVLLCPGWRGDQSSMGTTLSDG